MKRTVTATLILFVSFFISMNSTEAQAADSCLFVELQVGEKVQLRPVEGLNILNNLKWSNFDETVAVVDNNGLVTGVSNGITDVV